MSKWVYITIYLDEPFTFKYGDKKPEEISSFELGFFLVKATKRLYTSCSLVDGHHYRVKQFDVNDKSIITLFKVSHDIDLHLDARHKDLNLLQTSAMSDDARPLCWGMDEKYFDMIVKFVNGMMAKTE